MFLSVKEMELRKVRFDETFEPGQIDFTGEDLEQASPLAAKGTAELLAHSDGQMRIQGRYQGRNDLAVRSLSGRRALCPG